MKKLLKILPLAVVVFASLVAFSGCDKILEAFYPDETGTGGGDGGGGGGNFGVTLRVNVSTDVQGWASKMIVRIESTSGYSQDRRGFAYNQPGSNVATFIVSFDFIPEDDYRVFAWLDANNNGQFDEATEAKGGRDWFHLPWYDAGLRQQNDHPEFPVDLVAPAQAGVNSVRVWVYIDTASVPDYANVDVAVFLKQMENQWFQDPVHKGRAQLDNMNPGFAKFETSYDFLPTGTYKASAWLDLNGDNIWNPEEATGMSIWTDHGEIFPVPYYFPWDPNHPPGTDFHFEAWLYGPPPEDVVVPPVHLMGREVYNWDVELGWGNNYRLAVLNKPDATYWVGPTYYDWSLEWGATTWGSSQSWSDTFPVDFYMSVIQWPNNSYNLRVYNTSLDVGSGDTVWVPDSNLEVRWIQEPAEVLNYTVQLNAWGLDGPPFNLDYYSSFNVKVEILDFNLWRMGYPPAEFPGYLYNGGFYFTTMWSPLGPNGNGVMPYHPVAWGYADKIRIYIDADRNGSYNDPEDLAAQREIGVDAYAGMDWAVDPPAYYAYVNLPPQRFLKRADFDAVYGMPYD